ncbi:MAG: hypothetical protein AAF226_18910, partial [Verrucomicrobiota bacterium]
QVPKLEQGQQLLQGLKDLYGNDVRYVVKSSRRCQIISDGADKAPLTPDDLGINFRFSAPEKEKGKSWSDKFRPETAWLDKRVAELNAKRDDSVERDTHDFFIGGQVKMEGAKYFWFFVWLMLGTAILFVPVVIFYKPKEYFHD